MLTHDLACVLQAGDEAFSRAAPRNNILVTGGAGFIGSHLVDLLLAEDAWRVVVVDNFDPFYSPKIKRANVAVHLTNPHYKLYERDIRNREALRDIFAESKFSAVVHLAALAGVRPSLENPGSYLDVNVTGTLNLLECTREFGVKHFVFGSSSSVYGINSKVPFSESDKVVQPISPYAASKASGELLCHTYSHLYGIRCVCLRFFTVYGPRQRPDLAIHKFATLIAEEKPIPVFGDGTTRRDYTHVDDIVQGLRAAVSFRKANYEIFNLGESQTIELRELIALIEFSIGKKAIIKRLENQAGDVPITYADISKSRRFLNYNPRVTINHGIPTFVDWVFRRDRTSQDLN